MSSMTLLDARELGLPELENSVIETIVTQDQFFPRLPVRRIDGTTLTYNRELVLGDVIFTGTGVDQTFTDLGGGDNPAQFEKVSSEMVGLMAQAELAGIITATVGNAVDPMAAQVFSKTKNLGRTIANTVINGTGANNDFPGLLSLVPASQGNTPSTDGDALTLEAMDDLAARVGHNSNSPDYYLGNRKAWNKLKNLARSAGGATITEIKLGENVVAKPENTIGMYDGVPFLINDYIPSNQTQGASSDCTTIFAGLWDDGSSRLGCSLFIPSRVENFINMEDIGVHHNKDTRAIRLTAYMGFAVFSQTSVAKLTGIRTSI